MRSTISLILLLLTTSALLAQRVSFEDPDLTFSFKKPKKWQVFDDGYVVKVSPSAQDSAELFLTITYFEAAQPYGQMPFLSNSSNNPRKENKSEMKIAGKPADVEKENKEGVLIDRYSFEKFGQRFEIRTQCSDTRHKRYFRQIIRSIQITR